jgi:IS1 family transposase
VSLLTLSKRSEVIAHLREGAGVRPTSRLANVSQPTILALLLKVGAGCDRLHDQLVRDLDIRDIQADEIWSFIQKKQARVKPEDDPSFGDAYTFLALARTQKCVISYRMGKRDEQSARAFMRDLRARLVTVPLVSTDGFAPYAAAVEQHFEAVDFGQVVKNYSRSSRRVRDGQPSDHRYEPPRDPFAVRTPLHGTPDVAKLCTSHVERLNLDVRMSTRLCDGFSRKLSHHAVAISLFGAHHNFVRIQGALGCTPAMEAGITDRVWDVEELVHHALAALEAPAMPVVKQPLRMPDREPSAPEAPVRELPNGRGFLRLVTGGSWAPAPKAPEPPLAMPIESPRGTGATGEPAQLDLFAWEQEPVPSPMGSTIEAKQWKQLSLFIDEGDQMGPGGTL